MIHSLIIEHKKIAEFKTIRSARAAWQIAFDALISAGVDVTALPVIITSEMESTK